ncbi:hypothetical protein KY343_06290 [Candidatus Woesearchaeota archaeon]|nr:hypothetical protein [Candidatus Woesearchaeota archaeon]
MKREMFWAYGSGRFPTVAVILLVVGIVWLLSDLGIITVSIPWWPIILIVIALGWIINRYTQK